MDARAPDQMYVKVATGTVIDQAVSLIQEMHDRMTEQLAGTLKSGLCRRCSKPFGEWDTLHPLFRSWSTKCPDCHTRDIQLDFAHQNADD